MRKNLNKALAWTLAFALAFPTQAVAAMPASQGTETSDSTGQEAQSDGSGTAENSGQSGENDSSSGQEGSTDTGSSGTEDGSGGSSGEEEGSGTESGSGTENGSGDGSEEEEGSGTESGSDTEDGSETGSGEEEGSGTESGSGTEEGSETGSGEEEGAESGDTENGSGTDTGDADTGEAGSGDADTGDAGEDSGTGQGDNTTDASEEAPADGETESGSADDESAAEEIPEDTDVVLVEEPETPAETEETKAAEKKENESETYTVVYEVDPEDGATVKGDDEVKEGKDLTFKVTPEDGYKIESVSVNGEEVTDNKEKKSFLFFFGDTYYEYKVTDVEEDLSVEILMAEDILRASDGDTEVEIEADDKNALRDVSYVEISELGEDDSIEAAIKEQLSEKQIVDYKAVDITLYDKDGNVAEPDGDVSVRISGVETDEDYDEVFIYHLEEEETAQATSRMGAMPAVNAVSDEEDSVSYTAKEVKSGVEDAIEDEGMIRFTADAFSPYVVVFVKDGNEEVSFHLQDMDGRELKTDAFNVDAVSVGGDNINIRSFVEGNDLLQIVPDGEDETYIFQYATTDEEGNDKSEMIVYDDIGEDEAIYLWYEAVSSQSLNVKAHLYNASGQDISGSPFDVEIPAGEISDEKMREVLSSIEGDTEGFVPDNAEVQDDEGKKEEIKSAFKSGESIYVVKNDNRQMILGQDQSIYLNYRSGNDIIINVQGTDGNDDNAIVIDGNDRTGDGSFTTQYVKGSNTTLAIPVKIAQGYNVKITKGNDTVYDSFQDATQARYYTLTIAEQDFGQDNSLSYTVAYTWDGLTFDFSYVIQNNANGNHDPFHGSEVWIGKTADDLGSKPYDDGGYPRPTDTEYPITDNTFVVKFVTDGDYEWGKLEYMMDSFAINSQNVNVPNDDMTAETEILDQAGQTIANLTISCEPARNDQKGKYRIYIFTFTNVTGDLEVTGGNFKSTVNYEVVYSTKTEGVSSVERRDGRDYETWNIGTQTGLSDGNPVTFRITPEDGYYISGVKVTSEDGTRDEELQNASGSKWYGQRTARISYDENRRLNMLGVEASPIQYRFVYRNADNETEHTSVNTFVLTDKSQIPPVTDALMYVPQEATLPDGRVFAGWQLREQADDAVNADYYENGSVILASEIFSLEEYRIETDWSGFLWESSEEKGTIDYADEPEIADIILVPYYVDDVNAVKYPVTVEIFSPDNTTGEQVNLTVSKDSVMTIDAVQSYPAVREITAALEAKGYQLDPAQSTTTLTVSNSHGNTFEIYYTDKPVEITAAFAESSLGGEIDVAGGNYNVTPGTSVQLFGAIGEDITFEITPPRGYTIEKIQVNGTTEVENPDLTDGSYSFTYQVNKEDISKDHQIRIEVSLKQSSVAYSINYTYDGTSGSAPAGAITQGTGEFNAQIDLSDKVGTEELPSTVDHDGVNYMLDPGNGYTLTLSDPEGNNELTVNYVKDENEDGTPDSSQITVVFDLDDAAGERHGAAFTGVTVDGKTVILNEAEGTITFWLTKESGSYPAAPGVDIDYATEGYAFDGWTPVYTLTGTVPEEASSQIFQAVYAEDEVGGKDDNGGDEGDGIPDKYQVKVTYTVVNGYWNEGENDNADQVVYVTLQTNGTASVDGTATAQASAPGVGEKPLPGYAANSGEWTPSLNTEITIADQADGVEYTYSYELRSDVAYSVNYTYDGASGSAPAGAITQGTGEFNAQIDLSDKVGTEELPSTVDHDGVNYMLDPGNGYTLTLSDPEGNNELTVNYVKDENEDGTPDSSQITVVFDLDDAAGERHGAAFTGVTVDGKTVILNEAEGTITFWLTKGSDIYPAAPGVDIDYATEGYAFDGWYSVDTEYAGGQTVEESAVSQIYNAVYAEDNIGGTDEDGNDEGDGTPDKYQIKVRFKVLNGSFTDPMTAADPEAARLDGIRTIVVTLRDDSEEWSEEGSYLLSEADIPDIYPFDGFIAGAWDPELTDENRVIDAKDVTGDVREVWFLHTCVPGEGEFVDITFNAGENGTFEDEQKTLVFKVKTNDAFPEIPTPVGNETEDGKWIFTGWTDEAGNPVETFPETAGSTASYTAVYGFDGNNDNVPDESQLQAMIRPYDTTIYTGGDSAAGGGFPETELEVVIEDENGTVTEERPIQAESIESITINGYTFEGDAADVHSLFKVIYWNDASGWVENDQEDGHYTASLVFTNEAQPAFPESSTNDTGRLEGVLSDADGNPIPVKGADIGIEADYSGASGVQTMAENDADTTSYVVNADTGNLIVRKVEDMDANGATTEAVYRDVLASPEGIDPNGERATAVIPDGAEFYINGNEIRANSDRSGIKLLTDHIYNEANKENLLVERAFREAYGETGINAGNAAERGYGYVLRYYDLVDSENGNAWVESSKGVDVYIPYQAGTDINTAFEIRHFIGLHRETGITEAEVPEAIATCTLDDMGGSEAVKNTEQGIMFHTEGDQAFSPFIIMWKLDDNTGDNTPGDNTGGNGGDSDSDGGSSSPGAGPGASGSTYTAGVDGHWVHMDPDNIMIPISEDVPEGATPVTAPQWHQWKFILNNGMMLYDQWAYVKNPYAIGDQPDEGWFSFAENGIMEYGWYLDERTGKWYWMHRTSDGMLGTMLTGWHFDEQDGKWYYMSPRSGEMLLGWQEIDGKWYYFNPYAPAVTWEFNEATGGWTYNGANSRPYGSMYANETTPDGYTVGEDGAWIQ